MATVEGYKAGVLVPTPTVKTRGLPQMTLNLNTHHQTGAHYGWDKLRQQTQKGLMGQVCYGSCSGRLGLGLVPTFKAWRTRDRPGMDSSTSSLQWEHYWHFLFLHRVSVFLPIKWGGL